MVVGNGQVGVPLYLLNSFIWEKSDGTVVRDLLDRKTNRKSFYGSIKASTAVITFRFIQLHGINTITLHANRHDGESESD